jgi:hypothetical protein
MAKVRRGFDAILNGWRWFTCKIERIADEIRIAKPVLRGPRYKIIIGPLKFSESEKWMWPDLKKEIGRFREGKLVTGSDNLPEEVSNGNAEK